MRTPALALAAAAALLLGACGSVEYKDTNADVDKRIECDKASQHPGNVAPPWCQRSQGATWSSDKPGMQVDFGGKNE